MQYCSLPPLPPSRFSRVRLCVTPRTTAYQASLSMGFSRQEHWSGLPGFTLTKGHIHNWALFPLWLSCFILSGAISNCSLFFLSSILDTFQSGGLIFWFHIFCLFILFTKFLWEEHWSGLSFPPPVDHVLSELCKACLIALLSYTNPFIMTRLRSMSLYEYHLLYPCHWAKSRG